MAKVMNAITNFSTIGVVTLSALYLADNYYKFGLNREPGPLLAKLSPLWYRFEKSIGSFPSTMLRLHDEYGPIVRIGPNMLSLNSPDYLGKLHWLREQSEMRKENALLLGAYREMTAAACEVHINDIILKLLTNFNDFCGRDVSPEELDQRLKEMLYAFSHDVVMRLLFSDDLGLLDGETVPNNKEIRMFIRKMTMKHIQRWVSISKEMSVDDRPWNLTDSCLKSFANECSVFPIFDIAGIMEWTLNIFELASEMIFKASTRICFDTSLNCGKASTVEVAMTTTKMCSLISWKGLTEYTYLCGVIREGFRLARLSSTPINSTICMNQSAVINGHVLPAGVEFDLSTMRRSHFFGPEENEFKPERWMRSEDETAEEWEVRICDLEMADQLFYTGPDASPPKALARMIVFKLVTAFTLNLQVNLVPDQVPVSQAMSDQEPHIECPDHSLEVPSLRYMPEN